MPVNLRPSQLCNAFFFWLRIHIKGWGHKQGVSTSLHWVLVLANSLKFSCFSFLLSQGTKFLLKKKIQFDWLFPLLTLTSSEEGVGERNSDRPFIKQIKKRRFLLLPYLFSSCCLNVLPWLYFSLYFTCFIFTLRFFLSFFSLIIHIVKHTSYIQRSIYRHHALTK